MKGCRMSRFGLSHLVGCERIYVHRLFVLAPGRSWELFMDLAYAWVRHHSKFLWM